MQELSDGLTWSRHEAASTVSRDLGACFAGSHALLTVCIETVSIVTESTGVYTSVAIEERECGVASKARRASATTLFSTGFALVITWDALVGLFVSS